MENQINFPKNPKSGDTFITESGNVYKYSYQSDWRSTEFREQYKWEFIRNLKDPKIGHEKIVDGVTYVFEERLGDWEPHWYEKEEVKPSCNCNRHNDYCKTCGTVRHNYDRRSETFY